MVRNATGRLAKVFADSSPHARKHTICAKQAAGKILSQVDVVDYDLHSDEVADLPPAGSVAFSVQLREIAKGTGPAVGCPDGSKLSFDGLYAALTFNEVASKLAFKSVGETLHRSCVDPFWQCDVTFTLVPLK